MRHFPRTHGRRLAAGLLAAALSVTTLAAVPAVADDLKDKKRSVEKKIDSAEDDLHESSQTSVKAARRLTAAKRELASAQGTLAVAETTATKAQEEDARMQAELEKAEAELAAAQEALAEGKRAMRTQRAQVAATITDFYQQGDPSLLAFASLLEAHTPADLARQSEMRDAIVDREAQAYQALVATKVLLDVHEKQVEKAKEAVETQRQAAADHLVAMKALETAAQEARDAVATLVTAAQAAQAEADAAQAADQAALTKLKAEEERIATMLRRRAAKQGGGKTPGASGGVLSWPVSGGRLSSPYGMRQHPIYGYWGMHDGQDWAVGCGTPLRATANGTIASSFWSDVYGNRLVLDHGVLAGVGVASIYNHASSYVVRVGQRVKRGQLIGYVGDTGWSTGCHLHFTVMVNGSTVDPRNWL